MYHRMLEMIISVKLVYRVVKPLIVIATFYAADPLWDGRGCGPTSSCCSFNNPPWFCKQLSQSTNANLEVRLCSYGSASAENTPVQLIEIYTR